MKSCQHHGVPLSVMVAAVRSLSSEPPNTQQTRTFKAMITTDICGDSKWIRDGSEGGALDIYSSASTCTITFASATQGMPFNVRLERNINPSLKDSYYEVRVTDASKGASIGMGLVTENRFRPGWKIRGFFYNGNCTNGSAGLLIGFGKPITVGDVVGVRLMRDDASRKCSIIFYHNGRCLCAGFCVDDSNDEFYPCLHVSGGMTVSFSIPPPPSVFERETSVRDHDDPYSGDWSIEKAFVGPDLVELPLTTALMRQKVSLQKVAAASSEHDALYQLVIKICNSFCTAFKITGKTDAFDRIEFSGPCMSTRMMPAPSFTEMERLISLALNGKGDSGGFQKIISSDEGWLIMSGPTFEVLCSRYAEIFEPVSSINIRDLITIDEMELMAKNRN